MILEKAIFVNRAPFERLELDFKEKGVNVLTAINGKGKTTIITYIVDALYEAAKKGYRNQFEGTINKYYRVSSGLNMLKSNSPSIVYLRFKEGKNCHDYVDAIGTFTQNDYSNNVKLDNIIPFHKLENELLNHTCAKIWSDGLNAKNIKNIFAENVLTYFPSYRYEQPHFLNDPYSIHLNFTNESKFSGYLNNPIEVITGVKQLANWMLDILLDKKLAEEHGNVIYIGNKPYRELIPIEENTIHNNINKIISSALSSKHYDGDVRIGVDKRTSGMSRICIMNDDTKGNHESVCPTLFALSSGESAVLSIFAEILRQGDNNHPNSKMEDITGIVLIDEVDKHLHISLQKEILPKMFKLFPNVQFIVSSHSPFLNMGLADELPDNNQIIDLDNGGLVSSATNNAQYQEVYEMMLGEKQKYAEMYKSVKKELDLVKKPIVITEGKTDIMHILKAKEKLGIEDLDFDTIDKSKQPYGNNNLLTLLKQLSNVKNPHKIIGILDCDNLNNKDIKEIASIPFKDYGNNVYAFCIKAPQFREKEGHNEISIEMLYSDDEIHMPTDVSGRHLFLGNEFSEITGKGIKNKNLLLKNQGERGKFKIVESTDGQAVFDENDTNILSTKNCFAEAISNEFIKISNESWNNFQHIFNTLRTIIND